MRSLQAAFEGNPPHQFRNYCSAGDGGGQCRGGKTAAPNSSISNCDLTHRKSGRSADQSLFPHSGVFQLLDHFYGGVQHLITHCCRFQSKEIKGFLTWWGVCRRGMGGGGQDRKRFGDWLSLILSFLFHFLLRRLFFFFFIYWAVLSSRVSKPWLGGMRKGGPNKDSSFPSPDTWYKKKGKKRVFVACPLLFREAWAGRLYLLGGMSFNAKLTVHKGFFLNCFRKFTYDAPQKTFLTTKRKG